MAEPVCVYGATGYTGKLVAAELARRGAPMVLAGRSAEKLARAAELARAEGGEVVDVRPAPIDDHAALVAAFAGCPAVINAAGPFIHTGEPVLRATLEAGAHYLDTTGEQPWIREVFERWDAPLRDAGLAALPAMGFDYVPGDLLCHLVGSQVAPCDELLVAYDVAGFGMTRGTMHSALEMLKGGDVTYADGAWRAAGTGPLRASVVFPSPVGRRRMAKYPCGEVVTVPRHVELRSMRHLLSTRAIGAVGPLEQLLPFLTPAMELVLRSPVRHLLHRVIDRLPEGPPEDARRAAAWTIVVEARATDGRLAQGLVQGPDIYGLTAVMVVHGALLLAAGDARRSAGALSPAMAFEPRAFLRHLKPFGVDWDLPEKGALHRDAHQVAPRSGR